MKIRDRKILTIEDFRLRLRIDKDSLDNELVEQPELFYLVSQEFAYAMSRRDRAKDELKRTDARIGSIKRKKLERLGERPTIDRIASLVDISPDHQEEADRYTLAREEADKWSAMRDAFQQRSYALKDLCQLHVASYYANPNHRDQAPRESAYMRARAEVDASRKDFRVRISD